MFLCVSLVWKIAGGAGGVGVHACMWMILSMAMLSSTLGKSSTVSLLPILGGWARRARWWCWVQHSQAWTQRMLTFAFPDCCRERKNLLFHMLVLVATLSSTHCPSHPLLPPPPSPVLTRWLPEHCLPWVTVPDAECVHRHPHSAQLVFSFLRSLLAEMPVEALILRRVCHSSTHFSTFAIYPSYLHIFPLTFIKSTLRTTSASVCFSDQVFLSPSSLVFHALCLCWHMGAPLCRRAEDRNRPPDVTGTESQMYLAPLGRVPQKHVHPTSWSSPLRSPQNTRYKI